MMPQNIVRKHYPQNVEIGCVDCSAILGRVVVAGGCCVLCCAGRSTRAAACACFGLSLSTRGVLGPTIKPRGYGCPPPTPQGLSKALPGHRPSRALAPVSIWHPNYTTKSNFWQDFAGSLIPRMDVAASWPKGWRLQAFRGCSVELGAPACD